MVQYGSPLQYEMQCFSTFHVIYSYLHFRGSNFSIIINLIPNVKGKQDESRVQLLTSLRYTKKIDNK